MGYFLSLLIFVPLIGSGASLTLGSLGGRAKTASIVAAGFAGVTLLLGAYVFWSVMPPNTPGVGQYALTEDHPWVSVPGFGVDLLLGADGLSAPLVFVSSIVALLAIFSSRSLIARREPEYYALLLLAEASIMGAFTSLNLVAFYVFWELSLVSMFFLIGVWGGERRAYAALKFIVFTFTGSAVMLLGFLAVYFSASVSTFDIPDLVGKVPAGLQYLPLLAVFVGIAVEFPVFPFHSWQPDAYEQAPAPVNALLAGILPKFAGYAVIRVAIGLFPQAAFDYAWAFILVAVFSMFYGAIVAVLNRDLKRMFAYTSISHMGFVLFGAFATLASGNPLGIEGAILLMFTHALTIGALFTVSGFTQNVLGTRSIPLLAGMGQRAPLAAGLLAVVSCAAIGVPPFASFLAELMTISGGISANSLTAITVVVPVVVGGYFLWMLKHIVLDPLPTGAGEKRDISKGDAMVLAFYMVPLIVLTVFSYLIISPAAPVAQWAANLVHGGPHV